jgi:hypothetical protein
MIRALSVARFYLIRWGWVLGSNLLRRHDHDPGGCTCGCPIIGCPPCGGTRRDRALDSLGSL